MVIRGRAPLRVSFGGGGTDVEPFCVNQGGAIIGSTINKYAYCSIVPRDDEEIIVHSLDFDMTVKYNTRENYVYDGKLDLVKAALKGMDIRQGCEVYLQCDAPPGSGLFGKIPFLNNQWRCDFLLFFYDALNNGNVLFKNLFFFECFFCF